MKKLKIGYWPLSKSLTSPGDRRRLLFWAKSKGHEIVTDFTQNVDLIVASENSDFNSKLFSKTDVPIIFDLIDAYLSPLNYLDDLARGVAKKASGQISGQIKPYSQHVADFCERSSAVICSSPEQQDIIKTFNQNTHIILDSHQEIPFLEPRQMRNLQSAESRILWEGQPATIRGVEKISPVLDELSKRSKLVVDFVTDMKYHKYMNRYLERDTRELLERDLPNLAGRLTLTPWTSDNLVQVAKKSELAMIPIDLAIPIQRLKPENRLLIMWRLGLPCLTSRSPAYVRVASNAGATVACDDNDEWILNFTRLLEDADFAQSEILRGQNYVRENHSEVKLLKKWDAAVDSVMR
jgi:hypothetical protein